MKDFTTTNQKGSGAEAPWGNYLDLDDMDPSKRSTESICAER